MLSEVIEKMAERLPQMYFKPEEGVSSSTGFKNAVLNVKEIPEDRKLSDVFIGSEKDELYTMQTPVGEAEILYLDNREDFENFYRVTAGKCEPIDVPANMGACTLIGLNDIAKIKNHVKEYIKNGGQYPESEKMHFISDPNNYRFTLIVLSKGNYSNISHETAGFEKEKWLEISMNIRTYHELCHFMIRKLHKEKDAIWDEILADGMGLLFSIGTYDIKLASLFLGASESGYQNGGRLENYCKAENIDESAIKAFHSMQKFSEFVKHNADRCNDIYELILKAQENKDEFM